MIRSDVGNEVVGFASLLRGGDFGVGMVRCRSRLRPAGVAGRVQRCVTAVASRQGASFSSAASTRADDSEVFMARRDQLRAASDASSTKPGSKPGGSQAKRRSSTGHSVTRAH